MRLKDRCGGESKEEFRHWRDSENKVKMGGREKMICEESWRW